MKDKKNIYLLLPVVLLIWGAVLYQFFSYAGPGDPVLDPATNFTIQPLKIKEKDTFSINVQYRDPFLGKMYSTIKAGKGHSKASKGIKNAPGPIIWPSVLYKGIVSDTKDKTKVYMLIINGQTALMKKGDTQNEILLKDGDRNAVNVVFRGNKSAILLQK